MDLVLDINALAANHACCEVVDDDVTRDGRLLACLEDTSGGLACDLVLVDLDTGGAGGRDHPWRGHLRLGFRQPAAHTL